MYRVISLASEAHNGQERKVTGTPYISHPFSVASIVSNYTDNEEIIIAALLHDVIEDVDKDGYREQDITDTFGQRVADLVLDVSEDKSLPYDERKKEYLDRVKELDQDALLIKYADLYHNTLSILEDAKRYPKKLQETMNVAVYQNNVRNLYRELEQYFANKEALEELSGLVKTLDRLEYEK